MRFAFLRRAQPDVHVHVLVLVLVLACDRVPERGTAVDHGRALFSDAHTKAGKSNPFSCATCHPSTSTSTSTSTCVMFTGQTLAGATKRRTLWGGKRLDLLESINDCRLSFMDARSPWTRDDEDARAMYAYLATLDGPPDARPFTIVTDPPDVPAGDLARGKDVFERACQGCHGTIHEGKGALATFIPALPDKVNASHASLSVAERRRAFRDRVRAGAFTGVAGNMPPFSREALSDADLGALLAYLGQY